MGGRMSSGRRALLRERLVELARFVAPAMFLGLASCVSAPMTEVVVEPFPVSGQSFEVALNNTDARGIHGSIVVNGRPAFATVQPTWLTSFKLQEGRNICRYNASGQFALRTKVNLPEWRQRARANELDGLKWDVLLRYAVIHEAGHIEIFQKYTRMMTDVYRRTSAPTCEELDDMISRQLRPIFEAMSREHQVFDATDLPRMRRFLRQNGFDVVG